MCLVWPDDKPDDHSVLVEVDKNKTVAFLKHLIKDKHAPFLAHVAARDLTLWMLKEPIPEDEDIEKKLKKIHFDGSDSSIQPLRPPTSKISKHLKDGLLPDAIHILVEIPALDDVAPPPALPNLLEECQQFVANLSLSPPSTMIIAANFSETQEEDAQKSARNRPLTAHPTTPVVLFHQIMRKFIDDCKNNSLTSEDSLLVQKLTHEMSMIFPNEVARAARLRDILQDDEILATSPIISSNGGSCRADGFLGSRNHLISIFEVIGDINSEGTEPFDQAILCYARSVVKKSEKHPTFNFPCLI